MIPVLMLGAMAATEIAAAVGGTAAAAGAGYGLYRWRKNANKPEKKAKKKAKKVAKITKKMVKQRRPASEAAEIRRLNQLLEKLTTLAEQEMQASRRDAKASNAARPTRREAVAA